MKRRRNKVIVGVTLSMAMALSGCSLLPEEGEVMKAPIVETQPPYEFEMDIVKRETIYDSVLLYLKYIEVGGDKMSFSENGTVGEVFFEVGAEVKAGDVLAELDYVKDLREQLERLVKQLETEQVAYDALLKEKDFALRELNAKRRYGILTKAEFNTEEEKLDARYHDRIASYEDAILIDTMKKEQLEKRIAGGSLICQVDGMINSLNNLEAGRFIMANTVAARVVDTSSCVFEVTTEYANYFEVGENITLATTSADTNYETVVTSIEGDVVHLSPVSSDQVIPVNAQARYNLTLDVRENVLTLAIGCIRYEDNVPYVYYINEDGVRSVKTVAIGMRGAVSGSNAKTRIEITEGLELGDIVVKK